MKKLINILILLTLVGCNRDKNIIDTAEFENIKVEILSSRDKFGDEIKIKTDSQEFIIDVEGMNPWKVDFCNVDGKDVELAIGVYKESPHHKEKALRLFLYNIDFENERLKPKLRISRLYNPLVDFVMMDIDKDGLDEIVSIEENINKKYLLSGYNWTNFAFERTYSSQVLEEKPIYSNKEGIIKLKDNEYELFLEGEEIKWK